MGDRIKMDIARKVHADLAAYRDTLKENLGRQVTFSEALEWLLLAAEEKRTS